MDIVQVFLIISLTSLTVLLIVLGIQIFYILREVRATMRLANRTMTNVEDISQMMKHPAASLTSINGWGEMLAILKEGYRVYRSFKSKDA